MRNVDLLCGSHDSLNATSTPAILMSPSHPSNYPPNTNCRWVIESGYFERIQVKFVAMDVASSSSCDGDYVLLEDSNYRVGIFVVISLPRLLT